MAKLKKRLSKNRSSPRRLPVLIPTGMRYAKRGKTLVSADWDCLSATWDALTGKRIQAWDPAVENRLAFREGDKEGFCKFHYLSPNGEFAVLKISKCTILEEGPGDKE